MSKRRWLSGACRYIILGVCETGGDLGRLRSYDIKTWNFDGLLMACSVAFIEFVSEHDPDHHKSLELEISSLKPHLN